MEIREEIINRLLRILKRFCRRLKIAICLPLLIDNSEFKSIFKHHTKEFKKLYKLCIDAQFTEQQKNLKRSPSSEDGCMQVAIIKYESDKNSELTWAEALEGLNSYEDKILIIINGLFDEIPPNNKIIINHIELLKDYIEWQMNLTPKDLRERKFELRNSESLIKRKQNDINNFEAYFAEDTLKYTEMLEKSRIQMHQLNLTIDELMRKHREEIDLEMNSYKEKLRGQRDYVREEENNLDNQLSAHKAMLKTLRQANLEQEKVLRDQCLIVEKKCLAARNSYDRDLIKLHELKETLEMQLHVTLNHFEVLKNEYDVQTVIYTNLRIERERAMMKAFAEQLDNFEKNRAARIIQRTWRAYHERISSKKKKRSRKNK